MKTAIYTIEAISNLHVGSGNVNFGIVDNLIQRDAITGLPIIHSSSLKGALREYYSGKLKKENIEKIFGSDPKGDKRESGSYRFFDAFLLALPVRSDKAPFFLATCPQVINDFLEKVAVFGINLPDNISKGLKVLLDISTFPVVFTEKYKDALIEDLNEKTVFIPFENIIPLKALFGTYPLVLLSDADFNLLCKDSHLPVIARNHLNDGKSENLFYEQVLPRFTRLYFIIFRMSDEDCLPIAKELVQIGGNASVGYGYCKLSELKL